jgi:hypothetical protein
MCSWPRSTLTMTGALPTCAAIALHPHLTCCTVPLLRLRCTSGGESDEDEDPDAEDEVDNRHDGAQVDPGGSAAEPVLAIAGAGAGAGADAGTLAVSASGEDDPAAALPFGDSVRPEVCQLLTACGVSAAVCCSKMSRWEEVVKQASSVVRSTPGHVKALFLRGKAQRELGQFSLASDDLKQAATVSHCSRPARRSDRWPDTAVRATARAPAESDWSAARRCRTQQLPPTTPTH